MKYRGTSKMNYLKYLITMYKRTQKISADKPDFKPLERRYLFFYYIIRPLSFIPTLLLYKLNVSPNIVTWAGFILLLSTSFLFIIGSSEIYFILAIFVNIYLIFDMIDGNLARLYKSTNQYGKFIDGSLEVVGYSVLVLCLGYSVYQDSTKLVGLLLAAYVVWLEATEGYLVLRLARDKQNMPSISPNEFPQDDKSMSRNSAVQGGSDIFTKLFNIFHYIIKRFDSIKSLYIYNVIEPIKFPCFFILACYNEILYYLFIYAITSSLIRVPSIFIVFMRAKRELNFYRPT